MERLLVLVRHGQSEWNLKKLFTLNTGFQGAPLPDHPTDPATTAHRRRHTSRPDDTHKTTSSAAT